MSLGYIEGSLTPVGRHVAEDYRTVKRATKENCSAFRQSRIIPAVFVLLACMVPSVPDVWTRGRQLGPLGIDGSMWSAIAGLCVASVSMQLRQSWVTIVSLLGMCAMILLGLVESHVLHVDLIVVDIFAFAAIPVGAAWAFTTTDSERRLFLRVLHGANWIMLAGSNFLLMHNTIHRSVPGPRMFVYSEFSCTWALAVLTPFVYLDKDLWLGKKKVIAQLVLVCTTVLMAWTAYVSITRSVFIQLAMCLTFMAAGLVRFRKLSIRWLLVILLATTVFIGLLATLQSDKNLGFLPDSSQWSLEQRFSSTDLASEERVAEVHQLFLEYGGDLLVGRGLGSGFNSITLGKEGENYTIAPHIAVITLLMKGGVVAFALGIVLPAVLALKGVLFTKDPAVYGSGAGVLLYIAFSSISGGWSFPLLFCYGLFLSLMLTVNARRNVPVANKHAALDEAAEWD